MQKHVNAITYLQDVMITQLSPGESRLSVRAVPMILYDMSEAQYQGPTGEMAPNNVFSLETQRRLGETLGEAYRGAIEAYQDEIDYLEEVSRESHVGIDQAFQERRTLTQRNREIARQRRRSRHYRPRWYQE